MFAVLAAHRDICSAGAICEALRLRFCLPHCNSDWSTMAAWVRYSRGRLVYTGRITRAPFAGWVKTEEGQAAVKQAAARIRFSLLGKTRAATRRLWRQLADAARDPGVVDAIDVEVQAYPPRLGELAFAEGLPPWRLGFRALGLG